MEVTSPQASYAVGVVGYATGALGGDLGCAEADWAAIGSQLPAATDAAAGTSVAVDFSLAAGQDQVVRFVLAWCAPQWKGGGSPRATTTNTFTHMYAKHYPSAAETAAAAGHAARRTAGTHHRLAAGDLQRDAVARLAARCADQQLST